MSNQSPKMREIKMLTAPAESGQPEVSYKELLVTILQTPKNPQQGTTYAEMRVINPILDLIEATPSGKGVFLTESQWVEVKERVLAFPFRVNLRCLEKFCTHIEHAELVEMVKA